MIVDNYRRELLLLVFVGWMAYKMNSVLSGRHIPTYCLSVSEGIQDCVACIDLDNPEYRNVPFLTFKIRTPLSINSTLPISSDTLPSLRTSAVAYLIEQNGCSPFTCSELIDENDFWLTSVDNLRWSESNRLKVVGKPMEFKLTKGSFGKYVIGNSTGISLRYRLYSN